MTPVSRRWMPRRAAVLSVAAIFHWAGAVTTANSTASAGLSRKQHRRDLGTGTGIGLSFRTLHFPHERMAGARQPWPAFDLTMSLPPGSAPDRRLVNPSIVSEASSGVVGTMTREPAAGYRHSSGLDGGLNSLRSNIFHWRSGPATASRSAKQSRGP